MERSSLFSLALFPLKTVLFPHARLPLQIFEPRYLDLVKDCLKNNTGFGVVWLRQGQEVVTPGTGHSTKLADVGVYAQIVDWHTLDNGLLGVVIEGERKFRLHSSQQHVNKLWMGEAEWIIPEPIIPLPEHAGELDGLLQQLLQHPHVASLNINKHIEDVETLGCVLSQLLPIDEAIKYSLLSSMDSLTRLEELMDLLSGME